MEQSRVGAKLPWKPCVTLLSLLAWAIVARAAEKIEPVDAEFLEYLAELEGAEEDWTLFEREEPRHETAAGKQDSSSSPPKRDPKPAAEQTKSQ